MISGGFVVVPANTNVVFVDDPANREIVTSTECFSIAYHVSAMITFKGAYHLQKYFENDIDGNTLFLRSESGFVNDRLCKRWLEHFEKYTKNRTKGKYRLLIFNRYSSYITQEFINYC